MSNIAHHDDQSFEEMVKVSFGFAESAFRMRFCGVRPSGGDDPRDAALVARYTGSRFRFDIGWNEFELSLAVLINFDNPDLKRHERYVYFEPFVEYLTEGEETAIVPYVAENMSIRQIEAVMKRRRSVFQRGLSSVVEEVGRKVQYHFRKLVDASAEQVQGYHQWMNSKR